MREELAPALGNDDGAPMPDSEDTTDWILVANHVESWSVCVDLRDGVSLLLEKPW